MDPWQVTNTGVFYPTSPRAQDVRILDIAHALANINRFLGHTDRPYSVAQHSVLVSRKVPKRYMLAALMHDAAEAYCGDLPYPLKPKFHEFKEMEEEILKVIFKVFGIKWPMPKCIKTADLKMAYTERRDLFLVKTAPAMLWGEHTEPYPDHIVPWTWDDSKRAFMRKFQELTK